ncbi:hypothetical protein [Domibacillus aminovorans]|uniref:Uncharacterized protein n=1 Tax=Domibacillus aminovorans TaxID=29332 RepID=A0A177KYU1_9BACI|nr:hypothetical protein [Domibacillus aminovorans]OAH58588.1 hypothetical protein AWH49_18745 [Domibacillus aminovorans]
MLKEALQYIIGLKRPEIVETKDGKTYTPVSLTRLDREHDVAPIELRSLSGLVDYVQSNFDHERKLLIHVESPRSVRVYDALNDENDRRTYVKATAMLPSIIFERYMDRENFNVQLQACFVKNEDRDSVLKLISSIVEDNSLKTEDTGITQRVTAKTGITSVGVENVPNPVTLKPFRTFVEVTQPESEFILRLKEGPNVALFEADGAAWELNAMASIAEYLKENLAAEIADKKVYVID